MEKIKQYRVLLFAVIIYLLTRFYNLFLLPIFTDESIYIYWAKFIADTQSNWFISLGDGKPPLLIWIITVLLKILPADTYLLAGRLPSVFFGLATTIGIYKLSKLLFNSEKISATATFLYILSPFALLYDRMALFDSMLMSMLVWAAYFTVKTAKTLNWTNALLWGGFLGLAFWSKGTALVFLLLLPVCFVSFLDFKEFKKEYKKVIIFILLSVIIGEGINNLMRLSHGYFMMELKNQQFQQPWSELIENPTRLFTGNYKGIMSWLTSYYTWPLYLFGLFSFFIMLLKKNIREFSLLFTLWFFPVLVFSFFARELFPRYLLFILPYFLIACSFGINSVTDYIKSEVLLKIFSVMMIILLVPSLLFDFFLLTDPKRAPMPVNDYNQYVGDHPSGYGLDKVFSKLDTLSKNNKIILVTQGTFGLYPYAFYLNYWGNANIRIVPKWPVDLNKLDFPETGNAPKYYLIMKDFEYIPKDFPLKILEVGEKPGGRYPVILSEVTNN